LPKGKGGNSRTPDRTKNRLYYMKLWEKKVRNFFFEGSREGNGYRGAWVGDGGQQRPRQLIIPEEIFRELRLADHRRFRKNGKLNLREQCKSLQRVGRKKADDGFPRLISGKLQEVWKKGWEGRNDRACERMTSSGGEIQRPRFQEFACEVCKGFRMRGIASNPEEKGRNSRACRSGIPTPTTGEWSQGEGKSGTACQQGSTGLKGRGLSDHVKGVERGLKLTAGT